METPAICAWRIEVILKVVIERIKRWGTTMMLNVFSKLSEKIEIVVKVNENNAVFR